MILDCFTFFNEIKLLLVRLHYLEDLVDYFIISEGNQTFTGQPKPYYLDQCWDAIPSRISKKIVRVRGDTNEMPPGTNPWNREIYQRSILGEAAHRVAASTNATLIISDLDEVPHRDLLVVLKRVGLSTVLKLKQVNLCYNPDTKTGDWASAYIAPLQMVDVDKVEHIRRDHSIRQVDNAGWHFGYFASPELILHKVQSFSHQEFNRPEWANIHNIRHAISNRIDLFGRFKDIKFEEYSRDLYPRDLKNLLDLYFPYDEYNLYQQDQRPG